MSNSLFIKSLLSFSWVAAMIGGLVGVGLLLKHTHVLSLNQFFSRWVSTDKFAEKLDRERKSERFFYKHHKFLGAFLFLGSILALYTFLFSYNLRKISTIITPRFWWLLDAMMGLLLIGSVTAAIVGFIILLKPSLLRDIENSANRWISTEFLAKHLNGMNNSVEQAIVRHHQFAGLFLTIGSLYILVVLSYFFYRGSGVF